MKDYPGIDYDFRPKSYWDTASRSGKSREIVNLRLDSVHQEETGLFARVVSKGIAWSVGAPYDTDFGEWVVKPKVTAGPVTLRQLIKMMDEATFVSDDVKLHGGLALAWSNYNYDENLGTSYSDPEEWRDFTIVTSELYPQLAKHYQQVMEDWVSEKNKTREKKSPPNPK